jgi:hypothetical protein
VTRPLANRVSPFGDLFAGPARGTLMGNRGGRFHDPVARTVSGRPFASRQWICCVLAFRGRHRQVWGQGYTELFFLDEVTALAAGHRPCFVCRRADAVAFAGAWGRVTGHRPKAPEMDVVLHRERLAGPHWCDSAGLPEGAMVAFGDRAYAVRGAGLLPWMPAGYGPAQARMTGPVDVLTPPAILAVLAAGYRPVWHPSAPIA